MSRRRASLLAVVAAVPLLLAAAAIALIASLSQSPDGADPYEALRERRVERTAVRAEPAPPSVLDRVAGAEPAEVEAEPVLDAPVERIRIERIGVDAPVVVKNIDSRGYMEAPTGPEPVAWYDFTAKPGGGTGNAVLSGHLDYRNHGPAVFWDLKHLEPGDIVEIELADGSRIQYTVTGSSTYPVATIDMSEVLANTDDETMTLITCAGEFIRGDYTERLIVRAERSGVQPAS